MADLLSDTAGSVIVLRAEADSGTSVLLPFNVQVEGPMRDAITVVLEAFPVDSMVELDDPRADVSRTLVEFEIDVLSEAKRKEREASEVTVSVEMGTLGFAALLAITPGEDWDSTSLLLACVGRGDVEGKAELDKLSELETVIDLASVVSWGVVDSAVTKVGGSAVEVDE